MALADGLFVLEGMPGAGKTTAAVTLKAAGARVLGEYTDDAGLVVDVAAHPDVSDDDAHQGNWLRKAAQCTAMLAADVIALTADAAFPAAPASAPVAYVP